MQTIQPKILEIPGAKLNKTSGEKKNSKTRVYLASLSSSLDILENAVPFATGSSWKLKPVVLVEWKAPRILLRHEGVGRKGGKRSAYLNCNVFIEDN